MIFRTEIDIKKADFGITYADRLFFLGSCFSTNMADQLQAHKFPTLVNPTGVLFNPCSIANLLQRVIDNTAFAPEDTFLTDGIWRSFQLHGSFATASQDELLSIANSAISQAHQFIKKTTVLFITLGTAWAYRLKRTNEVVANCHKEPASSFERFRLTPDDVEAELLPVIQQLIEQNKKINIVFTVSPIRHWKDGAHGNQVSKSTLLLAIEQLVELFPGNVHYFPSYEIMMDDLRDYRFYADDMLHPSDEAIRYIFELFGKAYFSKETLKDMEDIRSVVQASQHRPLNPQSFSFQLFREKTLRKIEELEQKFPFLDFGREKAQMNGEANGKTI